MSSPLPLCAEPLTLSDEMLSVLRALPDPSHRIEPVVECQLQAGHTGSHLALGQGYGADVEAWLTWRQHAKPQIVTISEPGLCRGRQPEPGDPTDGATLCQLPSGHQGACSFDLEATMARDPSPELAERLQRVWDESGRPPLEAVGAPAALTSQLKEADSPVTRWLRTRFPRHERIQATFREAAGPQLVTPGPDVVHGTQDAAIEWWVRFDTDPAPSMALAAKGILAGLREFGRRACFSAAFSLLANLGVRGSITAPRPADPALFKRLSDERRAQVCYALALLVELDRAPRPSLANSRLWRVDAIGADGLRQLLLLTTPDEVADLAAMHDLAVRKLLPALPAGRVTSGAEFDGSADLAADADLIAGRTLIDIKAGQGGKPRKDGTRAAQLDRHVVDQLLGYTLLDYSDTWQIEAVAVYAARFGYLATWPLAELLPELAGQPVSLATSRAEFRRVLRGDLPRYLARQSTAA